MQKIKWILLFCLLGAFTLQAKTYTLESFIDLVKKNSDDLKLAAKDLEMAKAQKREAWATALPKISAQGNYRRNLLENYLYVDFPVEGGGTVRQKFKISKTNEYSVNAVLLQPIFSFKIGTALTAAKQYERMSQFIFQASDREILTFAKKGFYQALLLKKVWQLKKDAEQNAKDNYENVKKKFENGLASEFQLYQAEVRWQNAIPETQQARKNYELLMYNLKTLAGIDPEEDVDLQGNLETYPPMPKPVSFEETLKGRPDFMARLWEQKLRKTGLKAAIGDFFPTVDGTFAYTFSAQSDLWKLENRNNNFLLGLKVSVPIFLGGYNWAQVQKAKIELDKSKIRLDKAKKQIVTELHSIYLRLDEAKERISAARKALQTADKAFNIAEVSVKNGLITQLELKDAR
ncbi:MAG: TolC family protein, partial [Calditrichaeota bacterium]|nr:TolC family protein [Calditrichota bacterium]